MDRKDRPEHHHLSFLFHTSFLAAPGSIQRDRFAFEMHARVKRLSVFCATALGSRVPKHGARLGPPFEGRAPEAWRLLGRRLSL